MSSSVPFILKAQYERSKSLIGELTPELHIRNYFGYPRKFPALGRREDVTH